MKLIVIGASAGAFEALSVLLPSLPADYPCPIVVAVHVPPDKKNMLAEILDARCALNVQEAEDKAILQPGIIYVCPPDYHALIEKDGFISLSTEAPVLYSRPSIDVLFETAADAFDENVIGIILTGANDDGAAGLKAIGDAGGTTLILRPELAYASAMPLAAAKSCPKAQILSMDDISLFLRALND